MQELKEGIREKAQQLKDLDEQISLLESQIKDLKSDREKLSDDLVIDLQSTADIENGEGIRLADIGFVKLETKTYPRVIDLDGLIVWAQMKGQELPAMTINAATLGAWMREQIINSQPVPPEELVKSFVKTRIKINK